MRISLIAFIFASIHLSSTTGKSPTPLEQKLRDVEISGVQFFKSPLNEVMTELGRLAKKFDSKEKDPAKKGLNIIAIKEPNDGFPNVTITLNSMSLGQMIQFITETVEWQYEVRANAVVVSKYGRASKGTPLETEFYEVTQGSINRMTRGGTAGGGAGSDPFEPASGGGKGDDQGSKIKQFLEGTGIPFDETKGHQFVFDGFQIIVTHDRRSLDLIENVLRKLDSDFKRQVSVTFRLLETPVGLIDQVIAETAEAESDKTFRSILSREQAGRLLKVLLKEKQVELLHAANLLIMDAEPSSYSSTTEIIYPTDFISPPENNQSKLPQSLARFETVAPNNEQPGLREIGLTIDLTPRTMKYGTVNLELLPKLTRLIGHEEYGRGIKMPVFWSWQINTVVNLGSDETMISRGASSQEKKEIIVFVEASILK